MPGVADLTDIRAKLRRADEHFNTLKQEFGEWAKQVPSASYVNFGQDDPWHVVAIGPLPLPPPRFSTIVGDYLHNVRSALDYLVHQLVLREGKNPTRNHGFPFHKSEREFMQQVKFPIEHPERSALHGITVNGDAWAIIEAAQPYKRTHPNLYGLTVLSDFANREKHRALPIQAGFVEIVNLLQVIRWTPDIQPIQRQDSSGFLTLEQPTEVVRFRFPSGSNPSMQVNGNYAIYPTFGYGGAKQGTHVTLGTLLTMFEQVSEIVSQVTVLPNVRDEPRT